jgi:5'-deoxynucleotidase YfbR-like HD superfamily hydrolase
MHDAAEAYIGDMVRPVKRYLPDYSDIERHIWECAIAPAFGLHSQIPEIVRAADNVALVTERRDLMIPHPDDWGVNAEPLSERIQPWSSDWSDRAFLEAFAKYTNS